MTPSLFLSRKLKKTPKNTQKTKQHAERTRKARETLKDLPLKIKISPRANRKANNSAIKIHVSQGRLTVPKFREQKVTSERYEDEIPGIAPRMTLICGFARGIDQDFDIVLW